MSTAERLSPNPEEIGAHLQELTLQACLVARIAAGLVAEGIATGVASLLDGVRQREKELDLIDREIDQGVTSVITRVSEGRARELLACLKFMIGLERVGDLLLNCSNRAASVGSRIDLQDIRDLTLMASRLEKMLGDVHGALSQRDINKALAAGVTTERVDFAGAAAEAALADFYDIHAATGKREGFIVRDRDYELDQWRRLGKAGIASLWFAGVDGRDTGALLLQCGELLVYFAAGSRDGADMRRTRANHLLQWRIIRWAAESGFTGYDMGGVDTQSSPGIPQDESHPLWNLYLFKRRFGGKPVSRIHAYEYAPNPVLGAAWRTARHFR